MATTKHDRSARIVLGSGVLEQEPGDDQGVKERIASLRSRLGATEGNCTHTGWGD